MEFEVVEVKLLRGKDEPIVAIMSGQGPKYCDSLSLRLEAVQDPSQKQVFVNRFTIHAVVPAGSSTPRIGDKFVFGPHVDAAKKSIAESLPQIAKMLDNPEFQKALDGSDHKVDFKELFRIVAELGDMVDWDE